MQYVVVRLHIARGLTVNICDVMLLADVSAPSCLVGRDARASCKYTVS